MKKQEIKLGFTIWLELELKSKHIDEMCSKEFQKLIDDSIKKWVSYDWLQKNLCKTCCSKLSSEK